MFCSSTRAAADSSSTHAAAGFQFLLAPRRRFPYSSTSDAANCSSTCAAGGFLLLHAGISIGGGSSASFARRAVGGGEASPARSHALLGGGQWLNPARCRLAQPPQWLQACGGFVDVDDGGSPSSTAAACSLDGGMAGTPMPRSARHGAG
jgi:hypothetical protein